MTKATAKGLSLRAYAKHRGVSHEAVRQAIASKRLVKSIRKNARGQPEIISAAKADAEWNDNTDQSKPRNAVTGQPKRRAGDTEPYAPRDPGAADDGAPQLSYARARAVREGFLARLAKLEFEEKSKKLVPAEAVTVAGYNTARRARDAFLAIPDRLSSVLAGESDAREVHRILTQELRRVCEQMGKKPE